jgi:sugar O-acyltransferase (sialic acid O-acetyltransferase NeuD family)
MTTLTIIGAGGHGKVVADTAEACGFDDVRFVDIGWPARRQHGRWPITGLPHAGLEGPLFCAVGDNRTRAKLFYDLDLGQSPTLVHPSAVLSPSASLGAGTLVVAGAVINADAKLARGVILNTMSSVDHDCTLDDFVHIAPGAHLAGNVYVGARSMIGIGAVVREGVQIGADVMVAAGAAVIHDIEDGARVGGVPAKRI